MDTETTEAVETLRTDIHRVEAKVQHVETSLTEEINRLETPLTATIDRVETSLGTRMDEHKSQTWVRLESMHDDIRLLAGNLASLSVEVRSLRK